MKPEKRMTGGEFVDFALRAFASGHISEEICREIIGVEPRVKPRWWQRLWGSK